MKLVMLRSNEPRDRFPVCTSNLGRNTSANLETAKRISNVYDVEITYTPDSQGTDGEFFLNAENLTDLEIEGVHFLIIDKLKKFRRVYGEGN